MSKLERITYLCLITLSVLLIGLLIEARLSNRIVAADAQTPTAVALVGKKVEIPGAAWSFSPLNVVVYLSTTCHFCAESMPLYRRLATERHGPAGNAFTLVAVSAESPKDLLSYLAGQQVEFDSVYQIQLQNTLLRATPTVLIVDENGIVRRAAVGKLGAASEDALLRMVKAGRLKGGVGF